MPTSIKGIQLNETDWPKEKEKTRLSKDSDAFYKIFFVSFVEFYSRQIMINTTIDRTSHV